MVDLNPYGSYGENVGDYGNTHGPLAQIDYYELYEDKLTRVRQEMDERGLGALICLDDSNVEYITNIPVLHGGSQGGGRFAILPEDADPIVFAEASRAYHLDIAMPDYVTAKKAIPLPSSKPYTALPAAAKKHLIERNAEQIGGVLEDHGVSKETVGIDTDDEVLIRGLRNHGLDISTEGDEALQKARMVKTKWEKQIFRRLTSVIDGAFAKVAEIARPGVTEREVWAECNKYLINQGLSVDGGFIASGPSTWPKDSSREVTDRILRPGDTVFMDFFNMGYFGYRSCYYRSFNIGPPTDQVKEAYERMANWLYEAEKAVEPGVTTEEVIDSWPNEENQWGDIPPYIEDSSDAYTTYFMNMGHGIGLDLYEPPFFWKPTASEYPQTLEEGMVIALETMEATEDGTHGVRIEDMLIVTEDGCDILCRWPKDEITELPLYNT